MEMGRREWCASVQKPELDQKMNEMKWNMKWTLFYWKKRHRSKLCGLQAFDIVVKRG